MDSKQTAAVAGKIASGNWKSYMLGLIFLGLKVAGLITWPWVWVLMPFWFGPAIGLLILSGIALFLFFAVLAAGISSLLD